MLQKKSGEGLRIILQKNSGGTHVCSASTINRTRLCWANAASSFKRRYMREVLQKYNEGKVTHA